MIICRKRRIVIFMPPKTGTVSLHRIFRDRDLDVCEHGHGNYINFSLSCREDESYGKPEDYTAFAFYREPLDRAKSMLRYIKRRKCHEVFHAVYGNQVKISCLQPNTYFGLSPELKKMNDEIRLIDVFRKMTHVRDTAYKKQVNWLNYPNMNLLNYNDYDNEIRKLTELFGFHIDIIPRANMSIHVPDADVMTEDEENEIKEFYKDDYEFLNSKGLL